MSYPGKYLKIKKSTLAKIKINLTNILRKKGGSFMDVISIIGVPMDLGQSRRGVDMGPSAIRYAGVVERLEQLYYIVRDLGDIVISRPDDKDEQEDNLRNLRQVASGNQKLAEMVNAEVGQKKFPLILGGDHSIAIGSLAGIAKHYDNLGLIWYEIGRASCRESE